MLDEALAFLSRQPNALRVVLGAGATPQHAALGIGPLWIDADAAERVAERQRRRGPAADQRRLDVAVDLHRPGWWQRLALPRGSTDPALLLWGEDWAQRFNAQARHALLREIGTHAPPGTRLLLNLPAHAAVRLSARARSKPRVSAEGGLRSLAELTAPHPRLRIDAVRSVLAAGGAGPKLLDLGFRLASGLPWHAVYVIGVDA